MRFTVQALGRRLPPYIVDEGYAPNTFCLNLLFELAISALFRHLHWSAHKSQHTLFVRKCAATTSGRRFSAAVAFWLRLTFHSKAEHVLPHPVLCPSLWVGKQATNRDGGGGSQDVKS